MFIKISDRKKYLAFLFTFILLPACERQPKIPEDTLVKIYADIVIAQDTIALLSVPEVKRKILEQNNLTENDYEQSIDYYNEDPVKWELFFDKVIRHVENLQQNAVKQKTD